MCKDRRTENAKYILKSVELIAMIEIHVFEYQNEQITILSISTVPSVIKHMHN